MSERTPQDVLRELRRDIEGWTFSEYCASRDVILRLIDKAIAEASDSPHCDHGMAAHGPDGCLHCACTVPGRLLSEKPGLDVERLSEAISNVAVDADPNEGILASADNAESIAAEYDRLGSTGSEGR